MDNQPSFHIYDSQTDLSWVSVDAVAVTVDISSGTQVFTVHTRSAEGVTGERAPTAEELPHLTAAATAIAESVAETRRAYAADIFQCMPGTVARVSADVRTECPELSDAEVREQTISLIIQMMAEDEASANGSQG